MNYLENFYLITINVKNSFWVCVFTALQDYSSVSNQVGEAKWKWKIFENKNNYLTLGRQNVTFLNVQCNPHGVRKCPATAMGVSVKNHITRKPVFMGFRPGKANRPAQFRKLARVLKSIDVKLSEERTSKTLIRLCGCAGWSASLFFVRIEQCFY